MKEAMLYDKTGDGRVRCKLCAHRCLIDEGQRGICGVRENRGGTLYTLVYGRAISRDVDPIEKKPLFHFLPGTRAYSVATVGCNFTCLYCQNHHISQYPREHEGRIIGEKVSPSQIVTEAKKSGCKTIAYTYTEPTIFFEYALDTARLAHEEGL
ncbi:radical SAM protein, partial [Candidatus Bipolaricaulota bacterium]|nr:radical SAM protein [Candidatus Bipolaricaulota bacterium]